MPRYMRPSWLRISFLSLSAYGEKALRCPRAFTCAGFESSPDLRCAAVLDDGAGAGEKDGWRNCNLRALGVDGGGWGFAFGIVLLDSRDTGGQGLMLAEVRSCDPCTYFSSCETEMYVSFLTSMLWNICMQRGCH